MPDVIALCREAWNASKKDHQPAFDDLVQSYREMLQARAEAILATNHVSGDEPFYAFEKAVFDSSREILVEVKMEPTEEVVAERRAKEPKKSRVAATEAPPKVVKKSAKKGEKKR